MKKILVIVLAKEDQTYSKMQKAIRETWGKPEYVPNNITLKFNYGELYRGQTEVIDEGDSIFVNCEDIFQHLTLKTLECFRYVLKQYDFDYVFRCCNGSYVNLDRLNEWVNTNADTNVYSGINGFYHNVHYCSGSGYLISKDIISKIVNIQPVNYNEIDDIEIGRLVKLAGKDLDNNARRYDIEVNVPFHFTDNTHYHYHIMNKAENMYNIHNKLNRI